MAAIKKILVIRTDRIGEVLLSTPVITALKEKFPDAEISVLVKPQVRELFEGNPYVSEILEHTETEEGFAAALRLKKMIKPKKFDMAVIINPKRDYHLAVFLAGIPVRVGFDRKWGFLLTHKVEDTKYLAEKHEVEYNLDLARALGIEPKEKQPVFVIKEPDKFLEGRGPFAAIHPCTSNPKKQWPRENFARLGNMLAKKGYNMVIVSGPQEADFARKVASMMENKPVDLAGKLSLKELGAVLKKCAFLVSSDSGPVHIAAAVGTRAVVLFGGRDPGSNPKRWKPYGKDHVVLKKDRVEDILPQEVFAAIKNAYFNN
ncbi:MAG: glycosyltransferase family 9 protein [Candidatus Omnitrophica bacterium]|nr:glycosyltransferase family 9 protein [Candidatus Omnitrophota bacterium]